MVERIKARMEASPAAQGIAAELLFALALGIAGCLMIVLGAWIADIL